VTTEFDVAEETVAEETAAEETAVSRWDAVLPGIRAEALDCLQSTVAVLADAAYGSGAHLALGSRWRFPTLDDSGEFAVQPSVAERIDQARDVLGMRVEPVGGALDSAHLRDEAETGPIYIVSEAYDLSWLPYARATKRYREMPHSFLLERTGREYSVVDAYYADTEWGRARPTVVRMTGAEVDSAIGGTGLAVRMTTTTKSAPIDPRTAMADNAVVARRAEPAIDAYLARARASLTRPEGIERLVLDVWHLCRERLLYGLWLGDHEAAPLVLAATQAWQQLASQSYLASRRAHRGTPPHPALIDDMGAQLYADTELMTALGASALPIPQAAGSNLEDVIRSVIAEVVGLTDRELAELTAGSPLRLLPGFDSFRLVSVVDLVEERTGAVPASDASAADLADVAGLVRLFSRGTAPVSR